MKSVNPCLNLSVLLMLVLMFSGPLSPLVQAQSSSGNQNERENLLIDGAEYIFPEYHENPNSIEVQAIRAAERDASAHINRLMWFTTGFSLSFIGTFLSQRNQRTIPGARLIGKSPEYVAFYTNAYRIKMKKLRFNWSLVGCLSGTAIAGLVIFLSSR